MKSDSRQQGFTLVEVVVALAVVVVAFMAMYGSLQQMVSSATGMQEKTFASWVAYDLITEARVAREFPDGDKREGEIEMAGINWLYSMEFNKNTESEDILQVIVRVRPEYAPDNEVGLATGALVRPDNGGGGPPSGGPATDPQPAGSNSGASLVRSGPTDGTQVDPLPPGDDERGNPPGGLRPDEVLE